MSWADKIRKLKIRTNAESPEDAKQAIKFGAEGIGLCRTEHMFFDETRILAMRKMILADNDEDRRDAVMGLLPFQKEDFKSTLEDKIFLNFGTKVSISLPNYLAFFPVSSVCQNGDVKLVKRQIL